ncbi:MAG: hypothetical protein GC190_18460 [Alphaproteobacteria bacterium]|nr:hypothetical protein [Alphaproteobacteria bacterium]
MIASSGRASAAAVSAILLDIPAPIFAAAWTGETLFVHLAAAPQRRALRTRITAALNEAGVSRVRIRFHEGVQLSAPKSLERLVARFAGDEIVYDPTGAVARSRSLVTAGREVRAALGAKLTGLYYAPRLRTFYVALKAASLAKGEKLKVGALAEIERSVAAAMTAAFTPALDECPAIRVGFGLPAAGLVAVDVRSVQRWSTRLARSIRRLWKPVTLAALFGAGLAAGAQAREPAVSETNLKLSGSGGVADDESAWTAGAALTAPLGQYTGVQLEGGAAGVDDDTIWGAGVHLFTRDPDKYLLGLFASYAKEDDFNLDATRIGAEAEIYMNQISILAQAGYQFSDGFAGVGGDTAFGSLDLRWYATDNFAITAGGSFAQDQNQGHLMAEFMPGFSALPGLAFNVKGVIGENDFDSVMGGITFYFGSPASLKDRQRKQDPDTALYNLFNSVQEQRQKLNAMYGGQHP